MIYIIFNAKTMYGAYTIGEKGVYVWKKANAMRILKELCLQHGSTYEGRRDAMTAALMIKQKVPIMVEKKNQEIFFPTHRFRDAECMWINYGAITSVKRFKGKTQLFFKNGYAVCINCDIRGVRRAMDLCEKYLEFLAQYEVDTL